MIRQFAQSCKLTLEAARARANKTQTILDALPITNINDDYALFIWTSKTCNITMGLCSDCRTPGVQEAHASYERYLVTLTDDIKTENRVLVQRTLCGGCIKPRTHSALPDAAIPHMSHSLGFVLSILKKYITRASEGNTVERICAVSGISISTLYRWLTRFREHSALDLGRTATTEEIAARYWPPEGAIMSGMTRDFFARFGFSFMENAAIATQSGGDDKRVATIQAVPHKTGMSSADSKLYDESGAGKSPAGKENANDEDERPKENGGIQIWHRGAAIAKHIPGQDRSSLLQEGGGQSADLAGRYGKDIQPEHAQIMGGALRERRIGRIDQAAEDRQRLHSRAQSGRGGADAYHQGAIPKAACDADTFQNARRRANNGQGVVAMLSAVSQRVGGKKRPAGGREGSKGVRSGVFRRHMASG
jgi:hypothetical protein